MVQKKLTKKMMNDKYKVDDLIRIRLNDSMIWVTIVAINFIDNDTLEYMVSVLPNGKIKSAIPIREKDIICKQTSIHEQCSYA